MPVDDILKMAVVFSIIVVPALGITARFVLKPVVDAMLRLRGAGVLPGQPAGPEMAQLAAEVRALREEVSQMHGDVRRLEEVEAFHRALLQPADRPSDASRTPS